MKIVLPKAAEMRLRRRVKSTGHTLQQSRRAISPDNFGGYRIIDPYLNLTVAGEKFDLNADDVEEWLCQLGGWTVKLFAQKSSI